ncbi:TPA: hypothetical protein HA235_07215 [Candidatus Woesearchaeota archaeon]|nr:hypothetical protein [Candidatus Woesearchaeota archaeon]HIH32466.1 hypothetical protein [Candidatus Woesearchaeota archaeon]HIH54251.1 hypothetical protein [Candidatus Woesearchaeota archaeon]HIJ02589.1 hypothetical protein [Candidatus Woesearchaeota archaeon]HIJ13851.1 hypothetical protein [Candidatus Woesearchaeota archaeon]
MNKKSQIAIFVVLALIVLIVVGIFLYFYLQKNEPEQPRVEVSEELEPLQQFIEQCMNSLGREAVIKLGQHGGYINPNDPYLSGRIFVTSYDQKESDLAYLSRDPDSAIAYWYYSFSLQDCDNCLMMSQAPYIDEIERQIGIYVSENIYECLNDFEDFKSTLSITQSDYMHVEVTLRDNDIVLAGVYPLNITMLDTQQSMRDFYTEVDIPLMKYYLMALNITSNEYATGYLENLNIFLINSYSGLSSDMLPPLYSYSNNYDIIFWSQQSVMHKIDDLLNANIPLLQVPGTKNFKDIDGLSKYEENFVKFLNLGFLEGDLKNTEISFNYLSDGLYTKINPSNNEIIGPYQDVNDAGSVSLLPPRQVNTYEFFYDISYPVIVEIKDEYAPNEFYSFIFAIESNTKQNLKLKDYWNASLKPIYFEQQYFQRVFNDPLQGQKITDPATNKQYEYKVRPSDTLFCRNSQRISGDVQFRVLDAKTEQPLNNVIAKIGCGNYASCQLGQLKYNDTYKSVMFNNKLPICLNGYIQLDKQGYQTKKIPVTTEQGIDKNLGSAYIEPILAKNLKIRKYDVKRNVQYIAGNYIVSGYTLSNYSVPLGVNDTVILTLTRINSGALDMPFSKTVIVEGKENASIDLIPGRYEVKAQLIDNTGFIIYKECQEMCVNKNLLGMCTEYKKIPDKNIEITPALWGGIEFSGKMPFIVSRDDLVNDNIEFYVIRIPNPRCLDDMKEISMLKGFSSQHRFKLLPKFK